MRGQSGQRRCRDAFGPDELIPSRDQSGNDDASNGTSGRRKLNDSTGGFEPKRRLGRGLSALLGGGAPAAEETTTSDEAELRNLSVQELTRNPFQPRRDFDAESLGELSSSIREHGVLQPILVREVDGGFQVIAGERRWQAAVKPVSPRFPAGLST